MRAHTPIRDLETHPRKYVSPLQLAEYVGVTKRTIYHHIDKGALRVVKLGGVLRVHIEEAKRYVGVPSNTASTSRSV